MKYAALTAGAMAALATAGCATRAPVDPLPEEPMVSSARAELREPGGRIVALSSVSQIGDTMRVRVEASGLAPGIYGVHLHTFGRCDPPSFESAGGHWNPTAREHGRDNPRGQHLGDLPNLMVGTDGRGSFEFSIPGAWISGGRAPLLDADGTAIVIHARADDYRTDPSGNSGARIACGVFG